MTEGDAFRRIEGSIFDIRERMARIESDIIVALRLRDDVRKLQDAETRREGAMGAFAFIAKYGPLLVWGTITFIAGLLLQHGVLVK